MDFILSAESTLDISIDTQLKRDFRVLKMSYFVDDEVFGGDNHDLPSQEFYNKMRKGAKTSTSMVNCEDARVFFLAILKEGKDILHISFASSCSGTYDNVKKVADELNATAKNQIYVVDSTAESTAQGLIVELVDEKRKLGYSIKDCYEYAESIKGRVNSLFTVENLKYLARGGRVSKTSAFIGNLAQIKPLLWVDKGGKLLVGAKAIGRRVSLTKLVNMTKEKYTGEYPVIYVSHADSVEDALFCKRKLQSLIPQANIIIEQIGYVIGSHSGPGTIAIFFVGQDRCF